LGGTPATDGHWLRRVRLAQEAALLVKALLVLAGTPVGECGPV
jgi:hypothetical protein